jgi:integrase
LKRRGKPRLIGILDTSLYKLPYCEEASSFDKCIDYEKFTRIVLELFNEVVEARQHSSKKTFRLWSSYLGVIIIMLANGLRIKEALRAAKRFYEYGDRRFTIKAEKGGDTRLIVIPEFIERQDLEHLYRELIKYGEDHITWRIEKWLANVFGVNPHSIRYAYIRHHSLGGSSIEQIARALGLRKPQNVKTYYLRGLQLQGEGEGNGRTSRPREGVIGMG